VGCVNVVSELPRSAGAPLMDLDVNKGSIVHLFIADDVIGAIYDIDQKAMLH
jgi:hypothetical protein